MRTARDLQTGAHLPRRASCMTHSTKNWIIFSTSALTLILRVRHPIVYSFRRIASTGSINPFGTTFSRDKLIPGADSIFIVRKYLRFELFRVDSTCFELASDSGQFACERPVSQKIVLGAGLEPASLSAYAPQTYVSASSTTRAPRGGIFRRRPRLASVECILLAHASARTRNPNRNRDDRV